MRKKPNISDTFWRYVTNFWCLVAYILIVCDFLYNNALSDVLQPVLIIYVSLLTIFVGVKEFERWYETHQSRHPGELFVFGWTFLIIGLFIAKLVMHRSYELPNEVIATYIAVLSIMAITERSKKLRATRKK